MDNNYCIKVESFLKSIPSGKQVTLLNVCKAETMVLFIKTIKNIINTFWHDLGWEFFFNKDFTIIKRIDIENKNYLLQQFKN